MSARCCSVSSVPVAGGFNVATFVAMLPDREQARRVLAIAAAMLNVELPGDDPHPRTPR